MLNKEIIVTKEDVKKVILNNMYNELKHLDWFFLKNPEAFERTIDNILEEITSLRKLIKA